jgi:hypothetical protein
MIRKLLLVTAATVMPIGLVVATGASAGAAKPPPVNATTNTATCTTVKGDAKFSPPISENETVGGTETVTIKAKLSGCTSNATGLTIKGGSVAGSFSSTITSANGCVSLLGSNSESGTLTTKWKTTPALSSGDSVVTVNSVQGGVAPNGTNAEFQIPGTVPDSATGSFSGTDSGASGSTTAQSTSTVSQLSTDCGKKGIKELKLEPVAEASPPPAAFFG